MVGFFGLIAACSLTVSAGHGVAGGLAPATFTRTELSYRATRVLYPPQVSDATIFGRKYEKN
jgi:hypothetical protein